MGLFERQIKGIGNIESESCFADESPTPKPHTMDITDIRKDKKQLEDAIQVMVSQFVEKHNGSFMPQITVEVKGERLQSGKTVIVGTRVNITLLVQ